jgi:hypothetical protein
MSSWATILCQVHGHPELHLPQAQDTQTHQCHHRGGQDLAVMDCKQSSIELATTAVIAAELRELCLSALSTLTGSAILVQSLQGSRGCQGHASRHRGPCEDRPN